MDSDPATTPLVTRRRALELAAAVPVGLTGAAGARTGSRVPDAAWTTTLDTDEELVRVTGDGDLALAQTDSTLFGLDAMTGGVRFTRPIPDAFQFMRHDHGHAYLLANGVVHAIDPADGSDRWSFDLSLSTYPYTQITADALYVGADDLFAFEHGDGTVRWRTNDDRAGYPAGVHDGVVTTTNAGSRPGGAYDVETGDALHSFDAPDSYRAFGLAGDHYLGYGDDEMRVWDATTGEPAWTTTEYQFDDYADGAFFATSPEGLHRIDTEDWTPAWTASGESGGILTGVRDDIAYFRQSSGVLAIGLDGTVEWTYGSAQYPAFAPLETGGAYRTDSRLVRLDANGESQYSTNLSLPTDAPSWNLTATATNRVLAGVRDATIHGFRQALDAIGSGPLPTTTTQSTTTVTTSSSSQSTAPMGSSGGSVPGFGAATAAVSLGAAALYSLTRDD